MTGAVTGWAWRTPLGDSIDGVLGRLVAGVRAATDQLPFDASTCSVRVGAPIPSQPGRSPHERFLRRMGLFGVEAAKEATRAAGVRPGPRVGLFIAYGGLRAHWNEMMPALAAQEPDGRGAWERGLKLLHPDWMLRHLSNNAQALLAADLGAKGEGLTLAGANAGAQALSAALRSLEVGAVEVAVVVAYDSLLDPETLVELGARGTASSAPLSLLVAPYARGANGFVPGEAGAALVLEPKACAGARALAWVDAADGADGSAGAAAVETLARVARRVGQGEQVVDGAAQAQEPFDSAERRAIAALCAPGAVLTAVAGATGQLGAAMPLVQVIALAQALRSGTLPPIAGLEGTDEPGTTGLRPLVAAERTLARSALLLSAGSPGLAGAVRVEVP